MDNTKASTDTGAVAANAPADNSIPDSVSENVDSNAGASDASNQGVKVSILGRDFFVACDDEQRDSLDAAATFLDSQMRSIRDSGKVMGVERCAVMAALNISYELLDLRQEAGDVSHVRDRIKSISEKIDSVMEDTRQIAMN